MIGKMTISAKNIESVHAIVLYPVLQTVSQYVMTCYCRTIRWSKSP